MKNTKCKEILKEYCLQNKKDWEEIFQSIGEFGQWKYFEKLLNKERLIEEFEIFLEEMEF
jgi:hypothetical protein